MSDGAILLPALAAIYWGWELGGLPGAMLSWLIAPPLLFCLLYSKGDR